MSDYGFVCMYSGTLLAVTLEDLPKSLLAVIHTMNVHHMKILQCSCIPVHVNRNFLLTNCGSTVYEL